MERRAGPQEGGLARTQPQCRRAAIDRRLAGTTRPPSPDATGTLCSLSHAPTTTLKPNFGEGHRSLLRSCKPVCMSRIQRNIGQKFILTCRARMRARANICPHLPDVRATSSSFRIFTISLVAYYCFGEPLDRFLLLVCVQKVPTQICLGPGSRPGVARVCRFGPPRDGLIIVSLLF